MSHAPSASPVPAGPAPSPAAAPAGPAAPSGAVLAPPDPATAGLRAAHDALAARLEVRRSVDAVRKGAAFLFAGLTGVGFCAALAWDRWGSYVLPEGVERWKGPPLFLYVAMAVTPALLVIAIRSFAKARRLAREEDALFAEFRALRAKLGLEP